MVKCRLTQNNDSRKSHFSCAVMFSVSDELQTERLLATLEKRRIIERSFFWDKTTQLRILSCIMLCNSFLMKKEHQHFNTQHLAPFCMSPTEYAKHCFFLKYCWFSCFISGWLLRGILACGCWHHQPLWLVPFVSNHLLSVIIKYFAKMYCIGNRLIPEWPREMCLH